MKTITLKPVFFLALILVTLIPEGINGAKILFFMCVASHSHRVALQPLAAKLADIGHQVTFMTHTTTENPHENITEFFPESARKAMVGMVSHWGAEAVRGRMNERYYDPLLDPQILWEINLSGLEMAVINPEFQEWLKNSQFDLVIYDSPMKELATGIAYKMGAKVICFVTTATQWMYEFDMFGLPIETSWLPDSTAGSRYPFIPHHFLNAYNTLRWYFSFKWYFLPKTDEILTQIYGEKLPTSEELTRKVDLMLVNEHFSSTFPRSLPPFVIPVGGMHCKESKGILPKEMEKFVKSKERFVFISFGSAIEISALPEDKQQMLFQTLGSMEDTNFLWKWEGELPKDLPKNILAQNWFPQQEVLAHPKCKGFISQVGVMSYQQAVFHGVPLIAVPMWADQNYAAYSAVYHGNGIYLELADINKETLSEALNEILENKKYIDTAKEMSRRFKDRPMSAVDTAVWWTEYVLRHDTAHLKSPAIQQYWWQRRLLDFWGAVFIGILVTAFAIVKILSVIVRKATGSNGNTRSQKPKQS